MKMAVRHDAKPQALAKARSRAGVPKVGKGSGLTPRVKRAVSYFVFGWEGMTAETVITYDTAAERAGIKGRQLREALRKPGPLAHYQAEMQQLRSGQEPANVRALADIRDDAQMKKSPAGNRARVAAIAQLETDPRKEGGVNVAVQVNNVQQIRPGYVIRLQRRALPDGQQIEHEPAAASLGGVVEQQASGTAGGAPFAPRASAQAGVGAKFARTLPLSTPAHASSTPGDSGPENFSASARTPGGRHDERA